MNHVVVVNFGSFREVVDALGGITIVNPQPVLSKFECPFKGAERCSTFKGWRFRQGELELDGRRALIYARIRKNDLNPGRATSRAASGASASSTRSRARSWASRASCACR